MITLPVNNNPDKPFKVLCLGAHCDDIEIGCGATLLTLMARHPNVEIFWHVFTSTPEREKEARHGAELFCRSAASTTVRILNFRDGFLPYEGAAVKEAFEAIKPDFQPDLVFTHYRGDAHQDHRAIGELTWNTFRNHQILEYEIPKWDGDLGRPNCFVDISEDTARDKIRYLHDAYNSQNKKHWFTDDLFHSLMRIRGMESNSPSLLAEGFYTKKLKIG